MAGRILQQVSGPGMVRRRGYGGRRGKGLNKRQKQSVKRLISYQQEKKYFDTEVSVAASIDYSGTIWQLSAIPQGDTDSQRDGDKITARNLRIAYTVAVGSSTNIVRIIVFQWRSSSVPVVNTILQSIGTSNAPLSPYTHDYLPVITILYDRSHSLTSLQLPVITRTKTIYGKKLHKHINYTAAGVTGSYQLYMLAISDDGAATYPTMAFHTRLSYTDS